VEEKEGEEEDPKERGRREEKKGQFPPSFCSLFSARKSEEEEPPLHLLLFLLLIVPSPFPAPVTNKSGGTRGKELFFNRREVKNRLECQETRGDVAEERQEQSTLRA
jgi:hypothetical protein